MRTFVLLVGLVMLFVDDHQPEIGIGQKQRGARTDHDGSFARCNCSPVALPCARG